MRVGNTIKSRDLEDLSMYLYGESENASIALILT
jgi:hypothetical protein